MMNYDTNFFDNWFLLIVVSYFIAPNSDELMNL